MNLLFTALCCCLFHQATLCSMKGCMRAMVAQLKSDSEDLQQVSLVGPQASTPPPEDRFSSHEELSYT